MTDSQFHVGVLRGWPGILIGLLGSGLWLISGRQSLKHESLLGTVFSFLMAFIFIGGAIVLGIGAEIWGGALLGIAFFCLEIWLIWRWYERWCEQEHDKPEIN
jgi:membrane protein implicated in regulation of membrane protease activity